MCILPPLSFGVDEDFGKDYVHEQAANLAEEDYHFYQPKLVHSCELLAGGTMEVNRVIKVVVVLVYEHG
jgi:hypothetical protein